MTASGWNRGDDDFWRVGSNGVQEINKTDKTSPASAVGDSSTFQPVVALQSLPSLTLLPHLPICRQVELSHHFCWVGSHFNVSIGHVSEESFCCQSSTFQNIWALLNEWIVRSVFPVPVSPISFLSFPPRRRGKRSATANSLSDERDKWQRCFGSGDSPPLQISVCVLCVQDGGGVCWEARKR